MKRTFFSIAALLSLFAISSANAEEIVLCAGSGPMDSVFNPVKEAFEKETGIKIRNLFGSASLTLKQLNTNVCETASVGISFDDMLEIMKKDGVEFADAASFRHVTIGKSVIHTIVNKDNPVSKLSKEQLKGIFTGKITNWKQVNGNDSPIIVILSTLNPATFTSFRKIVLDNEPFTREVMEIGRVMGDLRDAVEANPEAICFGTSSILGKNVKRLETPTVVRPITLITKGEPSPKVNKLIDFILKGAGKGLVKE